MRRYKISKTYEPATFVGFEWVLETVDSQSHEVIDSVFGQTFGDIVEGIGSENQSRILDAIENVKDGNTFYQFALVTYFGNELQPRMSNKYTYVNLEIEGLRENPVFPELQREASKGNIPYFFLTELKSQYSRMEQ